MFATLIAWVVTLQAKFGAWFVLALAAPLAVLPVPALVPMDIPIKEDCTGTNLVMGLVQFGAGLIMGLIGVAAFAMVVVSLVIFVMKFKDKHTRGDVLPSMVTGLLGLIMLWIILSNSGLVTDMFSSKCV